MPEEASVLRIHQSPGSEGRHRVEVRFREPGRPEQSAHATVALSFSEQDRRDLRWYLEDYLQHPFDPAPAIAARVEERIEEIGSDLFGQVFQGSEQGRRLWARVSDRLSDLRVEVITGVTEAAAIPWELLRDPHAGTVLALTARSFVRTHDAPRQTPIALEPGEGPIRILLVICRPRAGEDVPFRSVASRLVKALSAETRAAYRLDVLRPPTFERLAAVLREAKAEGKPYHVVHFDGHGLYAELVDPKAADKEASAWLRRLGALALGGVQEGPHGYLLFENPDAEENLRPVGGTVLGNLLRETGVPVLVLNACRSAFAEPREAPETAETAPAEDAAPATGVPEGADSSDHAHAQVAAFGSLAQEVIDAGVTGVVAMQYTVYVVTAAQFVADLYGALLRGASLGQAVTLGRKQLHALPERTIAYDPRTLQDWPVPVVFEAAPTRLFPAGDDGDAPRLTIDAADSTSRVGALDEKLPRAPDAGFLGRDETLLALDRAFDRHPVVLLHAFAGSGKTATAAEFARWYSLTGGVKGPVLFSSFEQYLPLPRLLDRIGHLFGQGLEQAGIQWLALDDRRRREVALDVLRQVPWLWIWDNVEPVAGFPSGSDSAWSADEQAALADFLRDAAGAKAKFLLTSRRDERGWLGGLPCRVPVPPMPMQERVQLARALAEKAGRRLTEVEDWRPLLRFTEGNPLTITVLVGQALRDRLSTREQIETFVARLRKGEAAIADDAEQGRSGSLAASLQYGFDHAFTEEERKRLALLCFFQGFVDVDALRVMGDPEADWSLPEVRGLGREDWIPLLDRAAEVGLLTALGGGYYTIHPALPWFLKGLFDECFLAGGEGEGEAGRSSRGRASRAFVEAMGGLGDYYHRQFERGNRQVIGALTAEEANLLHAREMARAACWWDPVVGSMQGLQSLYSLTGRRAEWARLVVEIVPDFVDPANEGPLPGREKDWSLVTQYRVRLARENRDLQEAEWLQQVCVECDRRAAEEVVDRLVAMPPGQEEEPASAPAAVPQSGEDAVPPVPPLVAKLRSAGSSDLAPFDRNCLRSLGASLHDLAEIQREREEPTCIGTYGEALAVVQEIGDLQAAAICAFNLGTAFKDLPSLRDLDQAETWFRRSLELQAEGDGLGRGKCIGQMGSVALARFHTAQQAGEPEERLLAHLNDALGHYFQTLELLPTNAVHDLAVAHNQLGLTFEAAGDLERAQDHFAQSIRYQEAQGNRFGAGKSRRSIARALFKAARFPDAREYALAALRDFESYGDHAAAEIEKTRRLLAQIEQGLAQQR